MLVLRNIRGPSLIMRSCGNSNPTSVIAIEWSGNRTWDKYFTLGYKWSQCILKSHTTSCPWGVVWVMVTVFTEAQSLFPIIIAPSIEFRITILKFTGKEKSDPNRFLYYLQITFLEKEKQSCIVRASTRWFLLREVLQGRMPGNLETPSPCVINPLPALIRALPYSRLRSGQELQGCETLRLGKWTWCYHGRALSHCCGMLLVSRLCWCPTINFLHSGHFKWGEKIRILVIT